MSTFHLCLQAQPTEVESAPSQRIDGVSVRPLNLKSQSEIPAFAVGFDEAESALSRQSRMFFELDGSFLWRDAENAWQLEGNLYDHQERVVRVELWGRCDLAAWRDLLAALGHDRQPLMAQLVRQGVFLAEAEFRRWWESRAGWKIP